MLILYHKIRKCLKNITYKQQALWKKITIKLTLKKSKIYIVVYILRQIKSQLECEKYFFPNHDKIIQGK